jgi:microsomal epoxide hydrolase
VTVFPGEVYRPPEAWVRRVYRNLVHYRRAEKGGHFAAWEEPALFSAEVRSAFRGLR